MGAPGEVVDAWNGEVEPFAVFEENREIVELFIAADTQWRYAGANAVPAGLDYAGVRAAADAIGVAITPEVHSGLRVMERAATRALIELRGR